MTVFDDVSKSLAETVDALADAHAEAVHQPVTAGVVGDAGEALVRAAGDDGSAVFELEGPFSFVDAERETGRGKEEFVFEVFDADVRGGKRVIQLWFYGGFRIGKMMHDPHADHIRHRRRHMKL